MNKKEQLRDNGFKVEKNFSGEFVLLDFLDDKKEVFETYKEAVVASGV